MMCVIQTSLTAKTFIIPNPQGLMMGARQLSLGGTPTLLGDISGVLLNPAITGDIEEYVFSLSNQTIMDEFDYLTFNVGHKFNVNIKQNETIKNFPIGFALSLGSITLADIPETKEFYGFPEQIGTFNAGYNIIQASLGTTLYDQFYFDVLNVGLGLKLLRSYVDTYSTNTFGVDLGTIGTYNTNLKYLSRLEIAFAIQNIISPSMTYEESSSEILLPLKIYMGLKANILNDNTNLFLTSFEKGISLGLEGQIQDNMDLRASAVVDENKIDEFNAGAGLIFDNINLIPPFYKVSFRLDFNYTQHIFPMEQDPSYLVTLTSLGRSVPKSPTILYPNADVIITSKKENDLNGIGPKNSSIRIYNNNEFFRTTLTNKYGQWKINNLKLKEGENKIHIQSFDMLKDFSAKSNEVYIISDTQAPQLKTTVVPESDSTLKIEIQSNEKLSNLTVNINNTKVKLNETKILKEKNERSKVFKSIYYNSVYTGSFPFPNDLKPNQIIPETQYNIAIEAKDIAGNNYFSDSETFFASISFPTDKHVHYNETLLMLGDSSNTVKNIFINENPIAADKNNKFAIPIRLEAGKNLVKMTIETINNKYLDYYIRVLRLITYPDLNSRTKGRREIEFLSTLGIIIGDDDGNFYPTRNVTRQYITKLITHALELEIPESVDNDLYTDVPQNHPYARYILPAVNNGIMFAFPDGTFRPEQELTLDEAIIVLSEAGLIDYEETENASNLITRAELAEFLNYTPKFEKRINRLTNFESGYNP